ncbi:MAG: hypothetical protein ABJE47_10425 [bacterium]
MPVSHTTDTERNFVHTIFLGELDDDAVRERARKLRADPRFNDQMPELVDLSGVTGVSLTAEMMRVSARSLLHSSGVPCAIVAPDDRVFDFARAYQVLRERNNIMGLRVFRDTPAALDFLLDAGAIVEGQAPDGQAA